MIATPLPAEPQFVTVSAIVFPPEDGESRLEAPRLCVIRLRLKTDVQNVQKSSTLDVDLRRKLPKDCAQYQFLTPTLTAIQHNT